MVTQALAELGLDYTTFGMPNLPDGWQENQPPPELGEDPQVFYHFTSTVHLPAVLRFGIAKGDVPLTPTGGFNSPWLTSDPDFERQTWADAMPGDRPGDWAANRPLHGRSVRLEVHVPRGDPSLHHWPVLAKAHDVEAGWYKLLATLGQQPDYSDAWYVYTGRIPPEWVQAVAYQTIDDAASSGLYGLGKTSWR
jgi:hypothetical protein